MPKTKRKVAKRAVKRIVVTRKQLKSAEKKFKRMTKPAAKLVKQAEVKLESVRKTHWFKRAFQFVGAGLMMGLAALTAWRVKDAAHGLNFNDIKKQVTKKAEWASHEAEKQLKGSADKAKTMFRKEAKKTLQEANRRLNRMR
ncbi:MAG: hypothetical protein ACRCZE_00910 [Candidatus Altimarinota bacterium]